METNGFLVEVKQGRAEEGFPLGQDFIGGGSFVQVGLVIERRKLRRRREVVGGGGGGGGHGRREPAVSGGAAACEELGRIGPCNCIGSLE